MAYSAPKPSVETVRLTCKDTAFPVDRSESYAHPQITARCTQAFPMGSVLFINRPQEAGFTDRQAWFNGWSPT